jgi:ABC-2 type transport system ATP-binding protein
MPPIIRLEALTKRFGSETALDAVSLEVPPGTVFALLGENGAGKTTSIRIMLGLAEADAGRAEVLGLDSARQGLQIRQRVGYVPERPTLYDWMTVEEIGWFTAGFYGPGFLPEYARLVAQFGLPPRKKLKALSKGTRAKVALSLALAYQPELLILDEPTSGLDALVRREFLESMVDRAAQGQTVFLSSHQIGEVERVADIVAILRKGKLLLAEPLDQLKAQMRRLTVTLKDGATVPPLPSATILTQRYRPRQWQALVRGVADDQLAMLRAHESVDDVEVHVPSLEDIFVAYMQADDGVPQSDERNVLQKATQP